MLRPGRPFSPLVPLFAVGLLAIVLKPGRDDFIVILPLATLFVPWQAWVIRRAVHVMQVADYVAGKRYEAEGRYRLSAEYHDTEHATLAARRRRQHAKRP